MKPISIHVTALICAVLFSRLALLGQSIAPPAGWTVSEKKEKRIYEPTGLPAMESFTVTIDPPSSPVDDDLQRWFMDRVKSDAAQRNSFEETEPLQHGPSGLLTLERLYRDRVKRVWDVVYVGFPLRDHRVLFCLMASNLPESPTFHQYVHTGGKICGETAKIIDKSAPVAK